jgi:hypothetical protein
MVQVSYDLAFTGSIGFGVERVDLVKNVARGLDKPIYCAYADMRIDD